jgi:hypothetical protein
MKRRVKGMFVVGLFLVSASAIAAIDAKYDSDGFSNSLIIGKSLLFPVKSLDPLKGSIT